MSSHLHISGPHYNDYTNNRNGVSSLRASDSDELANACRDQHLLEQCYSILDACKDSAIRIGVKAFSVGNLKSPVSCHASPQKRINSGANPALRKDFLDWLTKQDKRKFPYLTAQSFEVVSGQTKEFNCFSYVVGITYEQIDPGSTMVDQTFFLHQHGFEPMKQLDFSLEEGKQKVVVYGKRPGDDGYDNLLKFEPHYFSEKADKAMITHAILQEADGTWTSKMGKLATIKIAHPDVLIGYNYGKPLKVFTRALSS